MKNWDSRRENLKNKTVDVFLAESIRFTIARPKTESDQVCLISMDAPLGQVISYDVESEEEMAALITSMQEIKKMIWGDPKEEVKPQS